MRVQQATVQRILELAQEHNLTINALAEKSGVADSRTGMFFRWMQSPGIFTSC